MHNIRNSNVDNSLKTIQVQTQVYRKQYFYRCLIKKRTSSLLKVVGEFCFKYSCLTMYTKISGVLLIDI